MRVDGVLIRINDTRIYHKVKLNSKIKLCHHSDGYIIGFDSQTQKLQLHGTIHKVSLFSRKTQPALIRYFTVYHSKGLHN